MNIRDEKVEPVTDLGLSLDYSSLYDQRIENNDPSAGANAGSSIQTTFVSANHLTELVWSPHKGLSLKCADCSFTERKPSLLWGAGTSNVCQSLSENPIAGLNCTIVPLDEPYSTAVEEIVDSKSGNSKKNNSDKFSICSSSLMPVPESREEEKAGNGVDAIDAKPHVEASMLNKNVGEGEEGDSRDRQRGGNHASIDKKSSETSKTRENSLPDSPGQIGGKSLDSPLPKLCYGDPSLKGKEVHNSSLIFGGDIALVSVNPLAEENKCSDAPASCPSKEKSRKGSRSDTSSLPHLDTLEATAENDLQMVNEEKTCGLATKIVVIESAHAGKSVSAEKRKMNLRDEPGAAKPSPSNSRIHKQHRKGKGKALSDGGFSGRVSKEQDDSYESVESCNSAGLFSTGKRRWSFKQQLMVGSKRAKQIHSISHSSSFEKHDSSFLNWIANMMKGLSKSNQEEDSLALALADPNQGHKECGNHTVPIDSKVQPHACKSMGFKSIFQSMYCLNRTAQEAKTTIPSIRFEEEPMEIDPIGKEDISIKLPASKSVLNESEIGNGGCASTVPQISFGNFAASLENNRSGSAEKKISSSFELGQSKEAVRSSNLSQNRLIKGYLDSNNSPSPEEKMTNDVGYRGDALRSLWITRFSTRTSVTLLKQGSFDFHRDQAALEMKESNSQEPLNVAQKEPNNCVISTEASIGSRQIESTQEKSLIHKMNQIVPSQRVKSSEAMASMFARRLDALKNIIPSDYVDGACRANTTCFFCGMKGHELQNCSDITEVELEDLLKNVKAYDNAEGSPCLCIRCFQLNHWAAACPNARSNKIQQQVEASQNPADHFNCGMKFKEISYHDNVISNSNVRKHSVLRHKGSSSNENERTLSGNDLRVQYPDVPKGIFDAIKMLQLSRADILNWLNSEISLAHLDGYFLRLRLGKWEEGLGGTGYYVARISGMQRESSKRNAKSPIPVNVGGIKCVVESQYISNHDFLEDELVAWWCTMSQGGGSIPSEADLKMKAAEKKRLGF